MKDDKPQLSRIEELKRLKKQEIEESKMKNYKVKITLPSFYTEVTASSEEDAVDTAFQIMHYESTEPNYDIEVVDREQKSKISDLSYGKEEKDWETIKGLRRTRVSSPTKEQLEWRESRTKAINTAFKEKVKFVPLLEREETMYEDEYEPQVWCYHKEDCDYGEGRGKLFSHKFFHKSDVLECIKAFQMDIDKRLMELAEFEGLQETFLQSEELRNVHKLIRKRFFGDDRK